MKAFIYFSIIFIYAAFPAQAQSDPLENIKRKFDLYYSAHPKNHIHVLFNQDKYAPGDTAWFKVYILDKDMKPISGREWIELNLIDSNAVSQQRISFIIDNGLGHNQIRIPDTIEAGIYLFTAKGTMNFDNPFVFKKEITVVKGHRIVPVTKNMASQPYPVPESVKQDFSLQVVPSERKEEPIKVRISSTQHTSLRSTELIVVLSARSKIYHTESFVQGNSEFIELQIPQADLPGGTAQLSLLHPDGTLLAFTDFYTPGEQIKLSIHTKKNHFQTREKVNMEILLANDKGEPIEGEFSVRVLNAALFDVQDDNGLSNNHLIVNSQPLPWEKILSYKGNAQNASIESTNQKKGTAYFSGTNEVLPEQSQIMFYLQHSNWRYQSVVMQNGEVQLNLPDLFTSDEFFYLAESKPGKEIRDITIKWEEEETLNSASAIPSKALNTLDPYASFSNKHKWIEQSYGFYTSVNSNKNTVSVSPNKAFEELVKGADISINLDDYARFPSMEELIKEVIASMYYRKAGQKDLVRVKLLDPLTATADPLYVIDGIATKNTEFFLSLKPTDLLTVKIVNSPKKLLPMGLLGKNGIVLIESKPGNLCEPLTDLSKLVRGLSKPMEFKTLDYTSVDYPQWPDFRASIYWNPSVKTNKDGNSSLSFFCSDDVGQLKIYIEGITKEGQLFSSVKELSVGFNSTDD